MKNIFLFIVMFLTITFCMGQGVINNLSHPVINHSVISNTDQLLVTGGGDIYNTFTTAVDTQKQEKPLIYPNPAHQTLTIQLLSDNDRITIYDNLGKVVYSQHNVSGDVQIDCLEFNDGMYMVSVCNGQLCTNEHVMVWNH